MKAWKKGGLISLSLAVFLAIVYYINYFLFQIKLIDQIIYPFFTIISPFQYFQLGFILPGIFSLLLIFSFFLLYYFCVGAIIGYLIEAKRKKTKYSYKIVILIIFMLIFFIWGISNIGNSEVYGNHVYRVREGCYNNTENIPNLIEVREASLVYKQEVIFANASKNLAKEEFSNLIDSLIENRLVCYDYMNSGFVIYNRKIEETNNEIIIIDKGKVNVVNDIGGGSMSRLVSITYTYNKQTGEISLEYN